MWKQVSFQALEMFIFSYTDYSLLTMSFDITGRKVRVLFNGKGDTLTSEEYKINPLLIISALYTIKNQGCVTSEEKYTLQLSGFIHFVRAFGIANYIQICYGVDMVSIIPMVSQFYSCFSRLIPSIPKRCKHALAIISCHRQFRCFLHTGYITGNICFHDLQTKKYML